MISTLDRYFGLSKHQTTFRTEVLAGLTTFLTMSYIIFVQPAILSGSLSGKPWSWPCSSWWPCCSARW